VLATAQTIRHQAAKLLLPPKRITVPESASKHVMSEGASGEMERWQAELTPYMIEPMLTLTNRKYKAVVFVGPARSGKTLAMIECFIAHIVTANPSDTLVVQMTQDMARDFSKKKITRLIKSSPAIASLINSKSEDDNVFDKTFLNGMVLNFGWPSISQLSSRTFAKVLITDFDRMPLDVDGEGSVFKLASKRTQTMLSAGKTVVESSPGYEYDSNGWSQKHKHEAPPADGIAQLYNSGTQHKLYWPCPDCKEYFLADMENLDRESAMMKCSHCGSMHSETKKRSMNASPKWIAREGREDSEIASFWMEGPAAKYQKWSSLIEQERIGLEAFESNGNHSLLKATINVDQGRWYCQPVKHKQRDINELLGRLEVWTKDTLPKGVRFLTAAVDQQKDCFVVQVHGWGARKESWIVARYKMRESRIRFDTEGKPLAMNPSSYYEDWAELKNVFERDYEGLKPLLIGIDTGGQNKATEHAYSFSKMIAGEEYATRLWLLKGNPNLAAGMLTQSESKDRRRVAPLWLVGTTAAKDELERMLNRESHGEGYLHIPRFLDDKTVLELTAEVRGLRGWEKTDKKRSNETQDLAAYNIALYYALGAHRIDWDDEKTIPAWAKERTSEKPIVNSWLELGKKFNKGN
jgi:phage terminase large subunit GpA-like protein